MGLAEGVGMLQPPLTPLRTLADIFGLNTSFSPRVPFSGRPFQPPEPAWVLDAQSAGSLTIAGDTRTICTRAAASPRARSTCSRPGTSIAISSRERGRRGDASPCSTSTRPTSFPQRPAG